MYDICSRVMFCSSLLVLCLSCFFFILHLLVTSSVNSLYFHVICVRAFMLKLGS